MLDDGITVDRRPSGFGSVELGWKYFNRDISIDGWHIATQPYSMIWHMIYATPQISRRRFSLMVENPRTSRKFSPSKVSCYTVWHKTLVQDWSTQSSTACPILPLQVAYLGPSSACMHTSLASQRVRGDHKNGGMAAKHTVFTRSDATFD